MILRATFLIVVLAVTGCSKDLVPADRTAIFPKENATALLGLCFHEPGGISGYWTPQPADMAGVEDHLQAYLRSRPRRQSPPTVEPNWGEYYRQVTGIEIGGQRYLFIAYAPFPYMHDPRYVADQKKELETQGRRYDPDWWRKYPLAVSDGGSAFFRVVYDPRTKQFVWYEQNGEA